MRALTRVLLLWVGLFSGLWADGLAPSWYSIGTDKKVSLQVELYLSSTCPHCQKEANFFNIMQLQNPWLQVKAYYIDKDKDALLAFSKRIRIQSTGDFAVPSAFFCDSRWIGFDTAETTGKDIMRGLTLCRDQIKASGRLTSATVNALQKLGNANYFDTGMVDTPSSTYYLLGMALLDATSPCSLFYFLTFLAFLFLRTDKKAQYRDGLVFVVILGLMHYVQQTNPALFYTFASWMRWPAVMVGLATLYLLGVLYRKQSVQAYLLPLAFCLAVLVQSFQQTCLMNWSYLFQQWLNHQAVSPLQSGLLGLLYQGLYLSIILLFLIAYTAVINRPKYSKARHYLQLLGQVILLFVAVLLIAYPQ